MSNMLKLYSWVIGDGMDQFFPINISCNEDIGDLKKAIKNEKNALQTMDADALTLWKVSIPVKELDTRLPAFQPLHAPDNGVYQLSPMDELLEVFSPEPPRKHLHIIVQPPIEHMRVKERQEEELSTEEAENEIIALLPGLKLSINLFLGGCELPKFRHTDVPMIFDKPNLILHKLGEPTEAMEELLKSVFNEKTQLVVNTSGSGKTRILLEGLCKHWGFYFTCASSKDLGSTDLAYALGHTGHPPFKLTASSVDDDRSNRFIARRFFQATLAARTILFNMFRELAISAGITEANQRRLWVLLQAWPNHPLISLDVFHTLTKRLCRAPPKFVADKLDKILVKLQQDLRVPLYLIIDEAQRAAKMYPESLISRTDQRSKRSILSELIASYYDTDLSLQLCIIVSGTGLQSTIVEENILSGSAKRILRPVHKFQQVGSFKDRGVQSAYIMEYLWPGKKLEELTNDATVLLSRAWWWLRGRYRVTSSFIETALEYDDLNPNLVLNHFFEHMCGYWPNDHEFTQEKREDIQIEHRPIITESMVKKLETEPNLFMMILGCLMDFILSSKISYENQKAKTLVEIGVAFFGENSDTIATINEPIAIYSLVSFFKTHGNNVGTYLQSIFAHARGTSHGNLFEEIIAWNLFTAFSTSRSLRSVFHFCGTPPKWADEYARLLVLSRVDGTVQSVTTDGCVFPFAFKAGNDLAVLEWAHNPGGVPILFPDRYCGPDVIMVLETMTTKQRIILSAQAKCTTNGDIAYTEALATVDPDKFYMQNRTKEDCKPWKPNSNLNAEFRGRLKSLNCEMTPANTLRVLATLPEKFEEAQRCVNVEKDAYPIAALFQPSFTQEANFSSLSNHVGNRVHGSLKHDINDPGGSVAKKAKTSKPPSSGTTNIDNPGRSGAKKARTSKPPSSRTTMTLRRRQPS